MRQHHLVRYVGEDEPAPRPGLVAMLVDPATPLILFDEANRAATPFELESANLMRDCEIASLLDARAAIGARMDQLEAEHGFGDPADPRG